MIFELLSSVVGVMMVAPIIMVFVLIVWIMKQERMR